MAASDVKALIVDPGGNACSYASLGLTTALILPFLGSIIRRQPSRSPNAVVAERKRAVSTSASLTPAGAGLRFGAGWSCRRAQAQIATLDTSKPMMSQRAPARTSLHESSLA